MTIHQNANIHIRQSQQTHQMSSAHQLVSVSLPCPKFDPLQVLAQSLGNERFYWSEQQAGVTYIGFGMAADLQSWGLERFAEMERKIASLFENAIFEGDTPSFAEPHCFGGFAFSNNFIPDNTWSVYHPAQFILPHYQLTIQENQGESSKAWLTLNALIDPDELAHEGTEVVLSHLTEALQERLQLLRQDTTIPSEQPMLRSLNYPMAYQTWEQIIQRAIEQFNGGRLSKAVLSRVCEIRFAQNVNVDSALAFLNHHYSDCYRFLFEPRPYHAFFGASPEALVTLRGKTLTTMALAGTEPRGATWDEDEALGQQLLHSTKDRHEHGLVVDALNRRLLPICATLEQPDVPQLLKLSNVQHLYTPVEAILQESKSIFDLVQLLHPTPALGGTPREQALAFIGEMEPVPRGWYAAPVGIVNRRLEGTFSVAIRSAVAEYERIWLHAGAGIVEASDPQKEWDETELKFRPILNSLGL
ncbi:MAG: isochorismate synthase [Chloroflexota bacterium]